MKRVTLGLDFGTSCVKGVLLSEDGEILGTGSSENALLLPKKGYAEQNPEDWLKAMKEVISQLKNRAPDTKICGIGLSGQMCGSVLLDREKKVLAPSIIWMDQRADTELEEIRKIISDNEIVERTSNDPLVSYWAPKLLWIKRHQPEIYGRTEHVLFPKDYIKYFLTGVIDIEVTDAAATMLFSTKKREWDWELFDRLNIPRSFVPARVSESTDVIGEVTKEAADYTGLTEGIPVIAGGGDQMCGGIGLGVVRNGVVASTIGTSGCVFSFSDKCVSDSSHQAILSYCHSVKNSWCVYGCTLTAGGAFSWLKNKIFDEIPDFDKMTDIASKSEPGSAGMIFLPYLNGERTPHPDPHARGIFYGMSLTHGKPEMIRSVMEGVTYSLRDTMEVLRSWAIPVNEVRAAGGGAASELWLQMQADIFNAKVIKTNVKEAPATGAAMMAMTGCGFYDDLIEISDKVVKVVSVTEPVTENVKQYDRYYRIYRRIYDSVKVLYDMSDEIEKEQ